MDIKRRRQDRITVLAEKYVYPVELSSRNLAVMWTGSDVDNAVK